MRMILAALVSLLLFCCNPEDRQSGKSTIFSNPSPEQDVSATNLVPSDSFQNLVSNLESPGRLIWQKPEMILTRFDTLEGKTVADIGAGTGYFAFRMLPLAERVIAIDIDPRFIRFMDSVRTLLPDTYREKFETRLAKANDPLIKDGEVDDVFIVDTYSYIGNRVDYMRRLREKMKAGGKVLIIDYKKKKMPIGPPNSQKLDMYAIEEELSAAGFQNIRTDDTSLDYQFIITAMRP